MYSLLTILITITPLPMSAENSEKPFRFLHKNDTQLMSYIKDNDEYITRSSRCAASLRNAFDDSHFAVAVLITMTHAITSALAIEMENEAFLERNQNAELANASLWNSNGLRLCHTKYHLRRDIRIYSNVINVSFYPKRSLVRTVDNPNLVRDDLAVLFYNCSHPPTDICRCSLAFLTQALPVGLEMHIAGFTGARPTQRTRDYSQHGVSEIVKCSTGTMFGHFFCIDSGRKNLYPYGPDAGAAIKEWNATVLGIGCFSLKMHNEKWIMYVTNISHMPYRIWLEQLVYNANYSDLSNMGHLQRPDHSKRLINTCHQLDFVRKKKVTQLPYGVDVSAFLTEDFPEE